MRILQINSVCGIRSTGRICAEMADQFVAQGHDCKIAYGREVVPERYQKYAVRIGSETSVKVNALKARLLDNEGFNAKAETRAFLKWAESYDPDLLWLHNLHGYYINVEMLFAWIKSRPQMKVMWLLHDCWAFTGHCAYFTVAGCEKWKTQCANCQIKKDYPSSFFRDHSPGNFAQKRKAFCGVENMTLVTPSQWLADLVKQSYLGEYPIHVIHNGSNLSVFQPTEGDFREKYGIEKDKFLVLGVAFGWGKRKGLDALIELSQRLDSQYQIVLVGTDAGVDAQLPENIISIHRTHNQQELVEIYTTADVFANPTREEVLGMVNVESLACGTPVVTFRTGGSPECIDETCGCVVECDDVAAMEREIRRICTQRPYSPEACMSWAKNFDMNTCFREYVALYESL